MEILIKQQLTPDEKIIYEGKPSKSSFLLSGPYIFYLSQIAFSAVFFVVLWTILLLSGFDFGGIVPREILWYLFLPVTFIMFFLTFVWLFFLVSQEHSNIYYILTDKKALIQQGTFSVEFLEVDLKKTQEIKITLQSSGKGNIVFGLPKNVSDYLKNRWELKGFLAIPEWLKRTMDVFNSYFLISYPTRYVLNCLPPTFYGIDNAQEIYNKILSLKNQ